MTPPPPALPRMGRAVPVGLALAVLSGVGVWLGLTLGEPPLQEGSAGRDETLAAAAVTPDLAAPDLAPAVSAAPDASPSTPDTTTRRGLWLATRPPGAEVVVDGTPAGTTPMEGQRISAGAVVLLLRKEGFAEQRIELPAGTGDVRLGPVALRPGPRPAHRPVQRTATLQVSTLVDGQHTPADVFLGNRPLGQSPLRLDQVPAGVPLTLTVRKAGFPPHVRRFRLQPGRIGRIVVDLKR